MRQNAPNPISISIFSGGDLRHCRWGIDTPVLSHLPADSLNGQDAGGKGVQLHVFRFLYIKNLQ